MNQLKEKAMNFKDTLRVLNKELKKLNDYEIGMTIFDVEYYNNVILASVLMPSGEKKVVIFDVRTLTPIEGGLHEA